MGRETAIALAKLGCHLAIVDIQEHLANDTAQFIAENYEVNTKAYKVSNKALVKIYGGLLAMWPSVIKN